MDTKIMKKRDQKSMPKNASNFEHFLNDFGLHFGGQKSFKHWKFEVPRRLWTQLGHSFTFSAKFEVPEARFLAILKYFGTKNWRFMKYLDIIFHKFRSPLTSKSCLPNLRSLKLDFWLFWNTLALKIRDFWNIWTSCFINFAALWRRGAEEMIRATSSRSIDR